MDELDYAIDFDDRTGARAYSFNDQGTPYLVGFGLRTLSTTQSVGSTLETAARTGLIEYGSELVFLNEPQQEALTDPVERMRLIDDVRTEHGFGPYLFEATTMPFDERLWQKLTSFYPAGVVFRALASEARDEGTLGGVAYPVAPTSEFSSILKRGTRFGGVRSEHLDRFLDLVISWTTAELEQNPRTATPPITTGPSYLFEREVTARIVDRN